MKRDTVFNRNELAWRNEMTHPVLIVGAGPVGLTMASELARFGIPVRIVDKAAQRTDKSKALVLGISYSTVTVLSAVMSVIKCSRMQEG
jgi:heterodisulfide reductase subunit A-like polyferredoxin